MKKSLSIGITLTLLGGGGLAAMGSTAFAEGSAPVTSPPSALSAEQASTTSQANAEVLQQFYAAFTKGDIEAAKSFVTSDFIMHVPGKGANAGEHWGREGLEKFMKNILSWNGGKFSMQVPHVAVNGDGGFTREVVDLNRKHDPERDWQIRFTMHYKFKAGKVSEAWTMPEDQRHYDAYWTAPEGGVPGATTPANAATTKGSPAIDISKATHSKNLKFGREFYKMFWENDIQGIEEVIDKDIVITIPGESDISGTFKGFAGFQEFRSKVMATVGDRYKLDVPDMAANDKGVFAEEFIRMNRPWNSKVEPIEVTLFYTIRDGKIVKMEDIPEDTYAWETFFTNPKE
jgi:ketosteroid isomerase-like protein